MELELEFLKRRAFKAEGQPAMKPKFNLPWFSKYLFSFFLVAFVFLLAGYITKPANAAFFNIVDPPTWSGDNVTFKWDNPGTSAAVLIIVDWDDPTHPSVYDSAAKGVSLLGKTQLTVSTTDWNIAVHPPDGRFKVSIVVGLTLVSNEVIFTVPVVGAPLCAFTFTPTSVAPSGQFFIQNINGVAGNPFTAGLKDSSGSILSNPPTQSGNFPASSLTFTAPSSAGNYTVFVQDNSTSPATQCVIPGLSSNILTVGSASPPPGTGCNIVPANTSWDPLKASVNGYAVTFTLPKPSDGIAGIVIEKDTDGTVAQDSGPLASGTNQWIWNAPTGSDGSYCAAIFWTTSAVSTVIHFTVPSAGNDTCTSNALNWVNDVRCKAIGGGWFDSDIFTLGQVGATFDTGNVLVWGKSQLNRNISDATQGRGALALTSNLIASLYAAPPASGVTYFAQKIQDLNPVRSAYAGAGGQFPGGIGYQALGPVQKIWVAFRNISYIGFIIVFVVMGFMIMFRAHISPQAVATVQDSIPRIVIALILVTFSYAIAGFMIDLMFLFLNIAVQALVSTHLISNADFVFKDNVFTVIFSNWKDAFGTVSDAISKIITQTIDLGMFNFVSKVLGWAGGTLAGLVVGIALLFIMFRVFLMLLMAYVMIILLTMFAPFFFLIQALPGNNGAKEWFKQMASNVAVFPVTAMMFIFAGILSGMTGLGGTGSGAIQPAQVGQFPLLIGGLDAGAIGNLIGIGFLLITPTAADMVKNMVGGGRGGGGGMGNIGAAALGGLAGGAAVVGAAGRGAGGALISRGPIGGWRRAQEARRGEEAQRTAHAGIYSKEYREWQEQLAKTRAKKDE